MLVGIIGSISLYRGVNELSFRMSSTSRLALLSLQWSWLSLMACIDRQVVVSQNLDIKKPPAISGRFVHTMVA
jgi:hypothetical protein